MSKQPTHKNMVCSSNQIPKMPPRKSIVLKEADIPDNVMIWAEQLADTYANSPSMYESIRDEMENNVDAESMAASLMAALSMAVRRARKV